MKRIIILLLISMLYACSKVDENDIDHWDIPINTIESVTIYHQIHKTQVNLEKEDAIQLIEKFNEIEANDIHWDILDDLQGCSDYQAYITIKTNKEDIVIGYSEFGTIYYNNTDYFTYFNLDYYDTMRNLETKYNFEILDWENDFLYDYGNQGLGVANPGEVVCDPKLKIVDALNAIGYKDVFSDSNMTMLDILEKQEKIQLNDVVEYDNIRVKIIEMKENNRITAVVLQYLG